MTSPDDTADLRRRQAPLEMTPDAFRQAGHELVDALGDFLEALPRGPLNHEATPKAVRGRLPAGALPENGHDPRALLRETHRLLVDGSLFNGHPRFFGYITSSAAPIGALADLLAGCINANMGAWELSPVASEIESQAVRWIGDLLGFPVGAGTLVSGGNMANLTAFLAARHARAEPELRTRGVQHERGRLLAYASEEVHTWIHKAVDIAGLGTDSLRLIPTRADLSIDVDALHDRLRADRDLGERPFLLVGTAGTVSTGAVDPLAELADVAREHDLWFHVDGAYGALAAVVPELQPLLEGLSAADSVAVDPHKWLYAPLEAGCVIVRDPEALRRAFSHQPSYYRFSGTEEDPPINYYEHGLQNSRGFRALKVWLGLRQAGRSGYRRMIADDVRLAQELHRLVEAAPELETGPRSLSITTFRYVPTALAGKGPSAEKELNELNEALLARLNSGGEAYLSNAVVRERFLLRACVCNFRTSLADIEALPGIVLRLGKELRP